eukprot:1026246-Pleurochrysis_carterae.AAC.1
MRSCLDDSCEPPLRRARGVACIAQDERAGESVQRQRSPLRPCPFVGAAGSSLYLPEFCQPARKKLASAREQLGFDGVDDVLGGAASSYDKRAPHDDVDGAPVCCLALHVGAERAYLKLAGLVEAE